MIRRRRLAAEQRRAKTFRWNRPSSRRPSRCCVTRKNVEPGRYSHRSTRVADAAVVECCRSNRQLPHQERTRTSRGALWYRRRQWSPDVMNSWAYSCTDQRGRDQYSPCLGSLRRAGRAARTSPDAAGRLGASAGQSRRGMNCASVRPRYQLGLNSNDGFSGPSAPGQADRELMAAVLALAQVHVPLQKRFALLFRVEVQVRTQPGVAHDRSRAYVRGRGGTGTAVASSYLWLRCAEVASPHCNIFVVRGCDCRRGRERRSRCGTASSRWLVPLVAVPK